METARLRFSRCFPFLTVSFSCRLSVGHAPLTHPEKPVTVGRYLKQLSRQRNFLWFVSMNLVQVGCELTRGRCCRKPSLDPRYVFLLCRCFTATSTATSSLCSWSTSCPTASLPPQGLYYWVRRAHSVLTGPRPREERGQNAQLISTRMIPFTSCFCSFLLFSCCFRSLSFNLPVLCSHTGVSYVAPHLNNLYFLTLCQRFGVYQVIRWLFMLKLGLSVAMLLAGADHIYLLCIFIARYGHTHTGTHIRGQMCDSLRFCLLCFGFF